MKNYVEMSSKQLNDLAYKIVKKVNKKHKYNWAKLTKIEKEKCYKLISQSRTLVYLYMS